jgi:hypothetical protein
LCVKLFRGNECNLLREPPRCRRVTFQDNVWVLFENVIFAICNNLRKKRVVHIVG